LVTESKKIWQTSSTGIIVSGRWSKSVISRLWTRNTNYWYPDVRRNWYFFLVCCNNIVACRPVAGQRPRHKQIYNSHF
jgi:hypothetical protein